MATSLSNETQTTNHTQTMATPKVKMMDASVGYSPPSSKSNSVAPRIIKPSKQVSPIISNYSRQDKVEENKINNGYHSIGLSAYNRKQAAIGTQILGKGGDVIKSGLGSGYMNKYDDDDEEGCGRSSSQEGSFSNGISTVDRDRTEGEGGGSNHTLQWNHVTPSKVEYSLSNQYSEVKQQFGNGSTQSDSAQNKQGGSSNNAKSNTAAGSNKNLNSPQVLNNKKQQKGSSSKNNNRGDTNSSAKKEWSSNQEARNDSQTRNSSSPNRYASSLTSSGGPSSMIQSAGLAYPFLYPNTYHLTSGFPASPAANTHQSYTGGYSGSGLQSSQQSVPERSSMGGNVGSSSNTSGPSNSTSGNSRRGGKKKAPLAAQSQNPEFRLFFNLRRRDQAIQSNKGSQAHHQVYKLKNPLNLQEWFKKLTVEERVNSLSTVCPHLTETFINMVQRMDSSIYGQSSCFARIGPHSTASDLKYYGGSTSSNGYGGYSGSSSYFQDHQYSSGSLGFDDLFYHRQSSSEYEQRLRNSSLNSSERAKNEAEQEILKHVRLTDYYKQLDTLTVNEELVLDPDYFLKLMSLATSNQAFTSASPFELRPSYTLSSYHHQYYGQPSSSNAPPILVVDQPSWFKPKSFHSFATWVIVALEENLWAHYNYETGQNMSTGIKQNDVQQLFRERTDSGVMDLEMGQLAAYWRECPDKDRKALVASLRQQVVKEWEVSPPVQEQAGGSIASQQFKSKVMQSQKMSYSVSIKEKTQTVSNAIQDQVDFELRGIVELAMRPGSEFELISSLMYTPMDRFQLKIQPIQRKMLDLIKKKYKDDLMENLLQEEYLGSGANKANNNSNNMSNQPSNNLAQSKSFKKKKKKQAKSAAAAQEATQSSSQEPDQPTPSPTPDQSTSDISIPQQINPVVSTEDTSIQQQSQQQQKKKKGANNSTNPQQQSTSGGNIQSKQNAINNQEPQHKDVNNLMQDKTPKTNMTAAASNKKKKTNNNNNNGNQPGSNNHKIDTNLTQSSSIQQQLQQQNMKLSASSSKQKQQDQKQLQQNKVEDEDSIKQLQNKDTRAAVKKEKIEEEIKDSQPIQSTVVLDQSPSSFPQNETFENNDEYDSDGQIRAYLLELTNYLVTEVCRRAAEVSDLSDNVEEKSGIIKDESQNNKSHTSSSEPLLSHSNKSENSVGINNSKNDDEPLIEQQLRTQSPNLHNQKPQAKDNAKQQENTQKKKNQSQYMNNKKPVPTDEAQAQQQQKKQSNKPQQSQQQPVPQPKVVVANAVTTEASADQSAQGKKKRNKKKSKLTDTDIMNNFMKSLHQHADDEQSSNLKKVNNNSEQHKKRSQQAQEEDPKKKNYTKTGATGAARKYTEDSAMANDQEDRKNKGHQKKPMVQQKRKQPSPTMNEDKNNGAEEVKDIVMGMVEKVSSQVVVLDEESKHEEDAICDIEVLEDQSKAKSEKIIDITDLSANDEQKQPEVVFMQNSSGGVDPKIFYQNFPQFIPSSISTTNSQGDLHSLDNDQTAAENNNCLTDCEIKEETKQSSIGGATGSSAGGIHQNYRTPPQSSKKQDVNQLSQQSVGVHHFASGEGMNMQSFSANSGSTLSNNFKRLHSQTDADLHNFVPTSTGNENQIQPGGVQSTFGGVSQNQFYGNFQSFGYNNSNHSSAQDYQPSTYQQPQTNYPPVPLTPPVPSNFQSQTLGNSSVYYPQSSRSPNLQNSHSMIFPNQNTPGLPTLHHSQSSQYHSSSSHSNKNNRNYNNGNKVQGHYQRPHAQRGVPRSHNNNSGQHHQQQVQLQIMNLSQSMQEQMQAHHQNPYNYQAFQPNMMDSQNIFYQDQTSTVGDNYGFQKPLIDHQVFPYLMEKSNSVNNTPLPSYSPQQQYPQSHHYQPSTTNEAVSNPFGNSNTACGGLSNLAASFRPSQSQSLQNQSSNPPYSDQSQDQIIFQIVNSIKSNLSTSPVPQQITSPPLPTHDQMSHHSSEHHSSEHIDPISVFYCHFDHEIEAYVNQIQENLNMLKPEREFVIAKLQEIAAKVFEKEQPKIEIFGSVITGLALESSDLDLAVTGLRIDDRMMMIDDLQMLSIALQNEWKSIESFKAIETASIPVIKMKVDLLKLREQEMKEREDGDFLMRVIPDNQRYLSVDITFDDTGSSSNSTSHSSYMNNYMMMNEQQQETSTHTHLGLSSCRLVQWYIQSYRNLRQVAILMKKFLSIHNFNSPYYGGLSSYSTVILIIAFMNYHGLRDDLRGAYFNRHENAYYTQDDMTPARLLMCFLDFYSYSFNPSLLGISVMGNGSFFPLNGGPNSSGNIGTSVQGLTPHSLYMQGTPIDQMLMNPGGFAAMAGLGGSNGGGFIVSSTSNMMILDPLNAQNNTTKNSFLTKDILKQFNSALSSLKTLISNFTQSPGITQSPLAQFLNLDQSPLQSAPSQFSLLTGHHASQFLPQSEVESSSLQVDRANTAETPTLSAVSSSSQNQQTVESVDAPSFKATIDNCMPGSFGQPKLPSSMNSVGTIQVEKHLIDKASEDDLVLKISEEIKRDSHDIKKVEQPSGIASRDQGIKGSNQDQVAFSNNSQLPKVKRLVEEPTRSMEAGKVRNYESQKDSHQAKKQQQVSQSPLQQTALKQHSSQSSSKSPTTTGQKKLK